MHECMVPILRVQEHRLTAHDQLFQDAHRRKLRHEEYSQWYPEEVTFKPRVNDPAKTLDLDGKLMPTTNLPVEQRWVPALLLQHWPSLPPTSSLRPTLSSSCRFG